MIPTPPPLLTPDEPKNWNGIELGDNNEFKIIPACSLNKVLMPNSKNTGFYQNHIPTGSNTFNDPIKPPVLNNPTVVEKSFEHVTKKMSLIPDLPVFSAAVSFSDYYKESFNLFYFVSLVKHCNRKYPHSYTSLQKKDAIMRFRTKKYEQITMPKKKVLSLWLLLKVLKYPGRKNYANIRPRENGRFKSNGKK